MPSDENSSRACLASFQMKGRVYGHWSERTMKHDTIISLSSKSWDHLPVTPDVVITVCGNAASETCPAYLGPAVRAHWGVDDPAHVEGSPEVIDAAFQRAYGVLRARISAFFALPLDALVQDRKRFQLELNRIGDINTQPS